MSIFVIGLTNGEGYGGRKAKMGIEAMLMIADKTGGEILHPESGKQLPEIFHHLSDELKSAYRMTYSPAGSVSNWRKQAKSRIETTRPHVKLLYPKG